MWGYTFQLPSPQSRQHHAVWFVSEPVCMLTPHEALGFHQQQPFVAVKIPPPPQNEPFAASWHPVFGLQVFGQKHGAALESHSWAVQSSSVTGERGTKGWLQLCLPVCWTQGVAE